MPVVMISGHGTIEMAVGRDPAGRLRLHREAVQVRPPAAGGARARWRRRGCARERRAAPARRPGDRAGRRVPRRSRSCARRSSRWRRPASRVLVHGPAGSGKEVVGAHDPCALAPRRRAVRGAQLRDPQPGALRGGAVRHRGRRRSAAQPRRAGVLERAHGGTLLLDEVADMPLETQGKIVRALQEQTFERVGGAAPGEGRCARARHHQPRPAGRDRRRPVPRGSLLPARRGAAAGAARCASGARTSRRWRGTSCARSARAVRHAAARAVGEDALAALQAYDWPGNVRQLRNLIDWLLIMAPGERGGRRSAPRCCRHEVGTVAPAVLNLDPMARDHGAAAARGARAVRDAVSAGAVDALRRQHQPHRGLRRHGAQRAAPQAQAAWRQFRGPWGRGVSRA